jgi:hypothetical protein
LRITALGALTTIPRRGAVSVDLLTYTAKPRSPARVPSFSTPRKSAGREIGAKAPIVAALCDLSREAGSSLGPTTLQDVPACFGAHPDAEAVLALTATVVRLIRSLGHGTSSNLVSNPIPLATVRWSRNSAGCRPVPQEYKRNAFVHVTGPGRN